MPKIHLKWYLRSSVPTSQQTQSASLTVPLALRVDMFPQREYFYHAIVCITRNFAHACWLLGDFIDKCEDMTLNDWPNLFLIWTHFYYAIFYTREILGWVYTCNVTAHRNTVSWQCRWDSWPRNVSKVGYAVTLRASWVCCRYLAVASKGWYDYGLRRCGRATSRCTSTLAPAVTVSSLWCDGQITTAHRKRP